MLDTDICMRQLATSFRPTSVSPASQLCKVSMVTQSQSSRDTGFVCSVNWISVELFRPIRTLLSQKKHQDSHNVSFQNKTATILKESAKTAHVKLWLGPWKSRRLKMIVTFVSSYCGYWNTRSGDRSNVLRPEW